MIRNLKSGEYRLYSRKKDKKTGSAAISAPSSRAWQPRSTSAKCSISSGIEASYVSFLVGQAVLPDMFLRSMDDLSCFRLADINPLRTNQLCHTGGVDTQCAVG